MSAAPPSSPREPAFLAIMGRRYLIEPDPAATAHRVPNRDGIAGEIRGRTFRRSDDRDRIFGWPLFYPQARQL